MTARNLVAADVRRRRREIRLLTSAATAVRVIFRSAGHQLSISTWSITGYQSEARFALGAEPASVANRRPGQPPDASVETTNLPGSAAFGAESF